MVSVVGCFGALWQSERPKPPVSGGCWLLSAKPEGGPDRSFDLEALDGGSGSVALEVATGCPVVPPSPTAIPGLPLP